jgi:ribonuclease HI
VAQTRIEPTKRFPYCDHFARVNELVKPAVQWAIKSDGDDADDAEKSPELPKNASPKHRPMAAPAHAFNTLFAGPPSPSPSIALPEVPSLNAVEFKIDEYVAYKDGKYAIGAGSNAIEWFCDGACTGNGRAYALGGFAAICVSGDDHGLVIMGKMTNASNIKAEGMAILRILLYIAAHKMDHKHVIYTDSEFWKNMVQKYMPRWDSDTFDKKANPQYTKPMFDLTTRLKDIVTIKWVPGHDKLGWSRADGDKLYCYTNNKIADALATYALAAMPLNSYTVARYGSAHARSAAAALNELALIELPQAYSAAPPE